MSWNEERIATLKRLWREGYTATEIANDLGGVSRNAVIGKAHRLGFESRRPTTPEMLGKIADLPIGIRTKRAIDNDNIIYVGDLVQKSEAELLRMPNFGRKSLNEVKVALSAINLRLGLWLADWPPESLSKEMEYLEAAQRVSELRQARGGATFQPSGEYFTMVTKGDEDDLAAAMKPMTQQMQSALLKMTRDFEDLAKRLDNQTGWSGISRTVASLLELLNRPPLEIPDVLGYLYPAAIELGSFIELDRQLEANSTSYALPLEPEVRRPLSSLVQNLAPWLRTFPSIREADDEASRFLVQMSELNSTFEVVESASTHVLLTQADMEVFRQLREAADRGEFQGSKAGGRAKRSATNFVIGVAAFLGTVYTGAIGSDVATTSPLVHKAGQFLVGAEKSIESLISDLPNDLRFSIIEFLTQLNDKPMILPERPMVVPTKPLSSRATPTKL